MKKIDLHIHSIYSSDGEHSIESIIKLSKEKNMDIISITDHNCVAGVEEAINLGKVNGIKVIPGIEIDCKFEEYDLHVLGYNIDFKLDKYKMLEIEVNSMQEKATVKRLELLNKYTGLELDYKELKKISKGKMITGAMMCETLLGKEEYFNNRYLKRYLPGGDRADSPLVNFYWDLLSKDKVAYVPIKFITLVEVIKLIKNSGGISVLAHPGQNLKEDRDKVKDIINLGIDGIEVYSNYHSIKETEYYLNIARDNKIIITAGSDFHGHIKPNIEIGSVRGDVCLGGII